MHNISDLESKCLWRLPGSLVRLAPLSPSQARCPPLPARPATRRMPACGGVESATAQFDSSSRTDLRREAHHVVVVSLDFLDEQSAESLDRESARLVDALAGIDVRS